MATRTILITNATGKQGRATVSALLSHPSSPSLRILALTRDPSSPSAQSLLTSHSGNQVILLPGSLTNSPTIFASQPPSTIHAAFLYTFLSSSSPAEDKDQAIPFIDAAVQHGVEHIVFSSVDRGGDEKSWSNPTAVKHFYEKHNAELYMRHKAAQPGVNLRWTVLRPTAFLDNLNPGTFGSVFAASWRASLRPETKLQLVSTRDIGRWAARTLLEPEKWAGRAVGLAAAELTLEEVRATFSRVMGGRALPESWTIVGKALLLMKKEVGLMFDFFEKEGYGADLEKLRSEDPEMEDLEAWLRSSSAWMADVPKA